MNISLTPKLESLIRTKVNSGLYGNASEVVREALRLLEEKDRVNALKLDILRKEIATGIASLDAGLGQSTSVDDIASRVLSGQDQDAS